MAAREGRAAPRVTGVIETALYVDDLARAACFYEDVLGLPALMGDSRFRAYDVGGRSVLLLFRRGATLETVRLPGGTIPPHDGRGPLHVAFAVPADDLPRGRGGWRRRASRSRDARRGRGEGRASTCAIRTAISSNSRRRGYGRSTKGAGATPRPAPAGALS